MKDIKQDKSKLSSEEKYILSRLKSKISKMNSVQKQYIFLTFIHNKFVRHSRNINVIVSSALTFAIYQTSGVAFPLIPNLKNDSNYKIPQELITKISRDGLTPHQKELIQHYKDENSFNLNWRKLENYFTYGLIFYSIYLTFENAEEIKRIIYGALSIVNFLGICQDDIVQYQIQNFDLNQIHVEQMNSFQEGYFKIHNRYLDPKIPKDKAILNSKWSSIQRQTSSDLRMQKSNKQGRQCQSN